MHSLCFVLIKKYNNDDAICETSPPKPNSDCGWCYVNGVYVVLNSVGSIALGNILLIFTAHPYVWQSKLTGRITIPPNNPYTTPSERST